MAIVLRLVRELEDKLVRIVLVALGRDADLAQHLKIVPRPLADALRLEQHPPLGKVRFALGKLRLDLFIKRVLSFVAF